MIQNAIDHLIVAGSHPAQAGNWTGWWLATWMKCFMPTQAPVSLCLLFKSCHLFPTKFKQVLRNSDGTEGKWLLSCRCSKLFSEIISVSKVCQSGIIHKSYNHMVSTSSIRRIPAQFRLKNKSLPMVIGLTGIIWNDSCDLVSHKASWFLLWKVVCARHLFNNVILIFLLLQRYKLWYLFQQL